MQVRGLDYTGAEATFRRVPGAAYIVTKRGRSAAVLLPVDEAEDLVLANADEYLQMRRAARAAHAKGETVNLRELV